MMCTCMKWCIWLDAGSRNSCRIDHSWHRVARVWGRNRFYVQTNSWVPHISAAHSRTEHYAQMHEIKYSTDIPAICRSNIRSSKCTESIPTQNWVLHRYAYVRSFARCKVPYFPIFCNIAHNHTSDTKFVCSIPLLSCIITLTGSVYGNRMWNWQVLFLRAAIVSSTVLVFVHTLLGMNLQATISFMRDVHNTWCIARSCNDGMSRLWSRGPNSHLLFE